MSDKKNINLQDTPTQELIEQLADIVVDIRKSVLEVNAKQAKYGLQDDPELTSLSEEGMSLYQKYRSALYYWQLQADVFSKVAEEINRPDSPYHDVPISAVPSDKFLEIIKYLKLPGEELVKPENEHSIISYIHSDTLKMSLDKISRVFFSFSAPAPTETNGQFSFSLSKDDGISTELGYEKEGEPEISLRYAYMFDEDTLKKLGMPKKITAYDFFVQTIFDNLEKSGNDVVSFTQAFYAMTGNKKPAPKQLEKFANSIYKQLSTTIIINDKEVMEAWNKLDPEKGKTYKEIVSPVLPVQIGSEKYTANGKIIDGAIKILAPPPVLQIGQQIGQYTTIPKALLVNNIRKTDRYYTLLHFLLSRIARMKHSNETNGRTATPTNHKILYKTIYEATGEKTSRDKQLSNECLFQILDHFKKCGWIEGYIKDHKTNTGGVGVVISLRTTELMNNPTELTN